MNDFKPFLLAAELLGHEGPVRAVRALPDGRLASASQDHTAKTWAPRDGKSSGNDAPYYEIADTLADHDHWVVSLAALPPGLLPECPQGGIVTGCMDKLVRVYSLAGKQERLLQGHEGGIISFSWTATGQLISGSWDGTAKVWDVAGAVCLVTLGGHENGVCVLGLPDGKIATGSTGRQDGGQVVDFQIRIWTENGQQIKSLREHSGPVRSLDLAPGYGFMSTSNDGTTRLWSLDGTSLATMPHPPTAEGQPTFVLQGCVLAGDATESVSVDESGGCVVWRGAERGQTIPHPSGLWCVCALPNGDFATGCQDHAVRVWTRDPERAAPAEVAQAFDKGVLDSQTKSKQGPSASEIAALPKWEERHATRGKSEGQVQVFQRAGKAIAAQWSAASAIWIEVGEVMGASDGGLVDGEAYDRVYPIEVEDDGGQVRKLQIGYNNGDNPFSAAQKFIDKNELPQSYLGQIADYITKRAGEAPPTLGVEGAAGSGAASGGFSGVGDPSGFANAPPPAVSSGTRGGSGVGGQHFPVTSYITFETGALAKVEAKIRELDGEIPDELKMSPGESIDLSRLSEILADGSRYHTSEVTPSQMALVTKLVGWPADKCFPCVDLCRLAALHPHFAEMVALGGAGDGNRLLVAIANKCSEGKDLMPVVLCALRFFCNVFRGRPSRKILLANASVVLDAVSDQAGGGIDNKNVKLALATLFLNLAVASRQEPLQDGLADAYQQLTALFAEVLGSVASLTDDVLYRFLVGLGTLLTGAPTCLEIAKDLDLSSSISSAQQGRKDTKVTDCCSRLLAVLR